MLVAVFLELVSSASDQFGTSNTPSINVQDAFNGGGATFSANSTNEKRFEYSNITSYTIKSHLLKFGGRLRNVQQTDQNSPTLAAKNR